MDAVAERGAEFALEVPDDPGHQGIEVGILTGDDGDIQRIRDRLDDPVLEDLGPSLHDHLEDGASVARAVRVPDEIILASDDRAEDRESALQPEDDRIPQSIADQGAGPRIKVRHEDGPAGSLGRGPRLELEVARLVAEMEEGRRPLLEAEEPEFRRTVHLDDVPAAERLGQDPPGGSVHRLAVADAEFGANEGDAVLGRVKRHSDEVAQIGV